ncbi:MAG: DUF433 domain-containing protein [Chloroflexi bacterium]|nr:DUF433 domain-containing protein [Chloroflexota bacterium]
MSDQVPVRVFGRHIVADPRICHGALTFRGTRIFVTDVLDQLAEGLSWDEIVASWGGGVSKEAIAEAIRLAHAALSEHWKELPAAAGE